MREAYLNQKGFVERGGAYFRFYLREEGFIRKEASWRGD